MNHNENIALRAIAKNDNASVAAMIRTVMPEFGACGEGFAIVDPEVDDMFTQYTQAGHCYLVYEKDGKIIGGGGVGALAGGEETICELKKMYFYPEARGLGLGYRMLEELLSRAQKLGYKRCYLETLDRMEGANRLYQKFGFEKVDQPLGNTGHFGCDRFLIKDL